jgi:hypothetical protein
MQKEIFPFYAFLWVSRSQWCEPAVSSMAWHGTAAPCSPPYGVACASKGRQKRPPPCGWGWDKIPVLKKIALNGLMHAPTEQDGNSVLICASRTTTLCILARSQVTHSWLQDILLISSCDAVHGTPQQQKTCPMP